MTVWASIAAGLEAEGAVVLVTVLRARGSVPREAGARMVVRRDGGFTGTIGGGTLEWRALAEAQAMMGSPAFTTRTYALGPELGQCCGGQVALGFERFSEADLAGAREFARREQEGRFATEANISDGKVERRLVPLAPGAPRASLDGDRLREVFGDDRRVVALYGAGHVGRALVLALAPLPFRVLWVDPRPDVFPAAVPGNVSLVRPADPIATVGDLPDGALVLAMTHSHALDLEIVAAALRASRFPYVGVIGSATKHARFESRLRAAGVTPDRLVCPIGAGGPKSKLPAAIAASVAVELLVADEAAARAGSGEPAAEGIRRWGTGR